MAGAERGAIVPLRRDSTFSGEKLCRHCDLLELSANKFLVGNAGKSLPSSRHISAKFRLNSGLGKTSLGKILDIKKRSEEIGCALCHLIFEATHRYSGQNVDDSSDCFMVWEVDGRQAAEQPTLATKHSSDDEDDKITSLHNVSRRIKIWWTQKNGSEMDAYILLLASSDKTLLHTDTKSSMRKTRQAVFLGQDFDAVKPKSALFKSWLDTCEGQHRSRSCDTGYIYYPTRFLNFVQATWFGVIDVIRMRICQLPMDKKTRMPTRYIALSYVWGNGKHDHRTIRKNMSVRIQPGGIEENSLPYTIRRAIQLTRDIGERYIWIDSLCIVQDSTFSWELNASEMDLVYGNAYLTICAADGEDHEAGLRALDVGYADTPLKAELGNGLRLLVSRPSESVIRDSMWNQRGWTFQERILSRRCLVFAGGRVYFQCRSGNMSQDIGPDTSGQGLSMDWKTSPLRTLDELKERPIWFYMTSVSLYTGRRLTKAKDILAAFKGVSGLIEPYIHGPSFKFVFGLPQSHFDLALLWSPLSAQKRRKPSGKQDANDDVLDKQDSYENDLPSWSWAGWMDAHEENKGSPVKYQQDMLDGCFIDIHEWLSKRTWINWFIRNSAGDLRPIWNKNLMPRIEGVLDRWHGYATDSGSYGPSMHFEPSDSTSSNDKSTDVSMRSFVQTANLITGAVVEERRRDFMDVPPPTLPRDQHYPPYPLDSSPYPLPPPPPPPEPIIVLPPAAPPTPVRFGGITATETRSTTETEDTETTRTERIDERDDYGRQVRWRKEQAKSSSFHGSIPDNPFGVNVASFDSNTTRNDRPILQFWTWRAHFYVVHNEAATEASPPGNGLVRCDIADDNADWCGHIVLNESYVKAIEGDPWMDFIALSDAKSFTKEECLNWAHYIPKAFDDIEWDLFFVMLIEWNKDTLTWERVGLGKIVQAAFRESTWEEILLG